MPFSIKHDFQSVFHSHEITPKFPPVSVYILISLDQAQALYLCP